MRVSEKILEKEFTSNTTKEAYLKCCKWVSTNIIAKDLGRLATYQITKVKKQNTTAIKLEVFVMVDEEEIHEKHCDICKEVSRNLFLAENKHMCESCKINPYRKRIFDRLDTVKKVVKEKVK